MKKKTITALLLAMTMTFSACAEAPNNTKKGKKNDEPTTTTTAEPTTTTTADPATAPDLVGNPDMDKKTRIGMIPSKDAEKHFIEDIRSYCSVIDWVEYSPVVAGSELTVQPIVNDDMDPDQTIKMYIFAHNDDYAWNLDDAYAVFEGTLCHGIIIDQDKTCSEYWISDMLPKAMPTGEYTLVFVHEDGTVDSMLDIDLVATTSEATQHLEVDKPVIYLYPEEELEVYVSLELEGELTCTYPQYNSAFGWHVLAHKNGSMYNFEDGRNYDYLFWEGLMDMDLAGFEKAICVKGEDTAKFLEEYLTAAGLNDSEIDDFISYWLPHMQNNAYNLISFPTDIYAEEAKLNVYPAPDTEIRVFMAFTALDEAVEIPADRALTMPSGVERNGFTVVEWGGTEI